MKPEALALSRDLALELGQKPFDGFDTDADAVTETGELIVYSRTRRGHAYRMALTPEGIGVHQGEGCESETYNGVLGCWHVKVASTKEGNEMTQALTTYQAPVPSRIEFSEEQIGVIKSTICRGASDAELGLFLATCRRTGLDPFLHQIHAVKRKVNNGTRDNPKWEEVLSIMVGIDGYRLLRDRTGEFDGMEGPQWSNDGNTWLDYWVDEKPPKLARVAIYRKGISRPFVATARWEAYNQGNSMWQKMGPEQLAKCAEALAYRRTFPAEMSAIPSGPVADMEPPDDTEMAELPEAVQALIEHGEFREVAPAPVTTTEEQRRLIADWQNAVKSERGDKALASVVSYAKGRWPYAVEDNRLKVLRLTEADATQYVAMLKVMHETGALDLGNVSAPAAEGVVCTEHMPQYNEDMSVLACSICGVVLEEEQEPQQAGFSE